MKVTAGMAGKAGAWRPHKEGQSTQDRKPVRGGPRNDVGFRDMEAFCDPHKSGFGGIMGKKT